jgi:hypothetical protein
MYTFFVNHKLNLDFLRKDIAIRVNDDLVAFYLQKNDVNIRKVSFSDSLNYLLIT